MTTALAHNILLKGRLNLWDLPLNGYERNLGCLRWRSRACSLRDWPTNCAMAQEETPAADAAAAEPAAEAAAADAPTDPVAELTTQLGDMKVGADTVWVLVTAMLVFFMNLGFATRRIRLVPGEERGQHSVEELHRVRGDDVVLLVLGWGIMFGNGTRLLRQGRPVVPRAAPTTARPPADAYSGRLQRDQLGPACRWKPSSSSNWCLPERPPRSFPAPSPSASSTFRSSCSAR